MLWYGIDNSGFLLGKIFLGKYQKNTLGYPKLSIVFEHFEGQKRLRGVVWGRPIPAPLKKKVCLCFFDQQNSFFC